MAELPPGQILGGKYTLQALLRRAPWGSTHRALTSPNREVVIKVLDASLAEHPDVLEAIRIAETAGAAVPAHLALRVIEQGVDAAAGVPYIVTPAAATPSLEQLVELCALSPREAVAFVLNLGKAFDALHFAGYEHLAFKPSNVFVGPTPECAVQVADFGANAVRARMDREAQLAFSAPWLAPEQVDGDQKAGPEADVFAAALVTFFAMTGRSLWPSCRGAVVDVSAWRAEIARTAPRASVAAAEIGATIDPAFDEAFANALASPAARTKSVGAFAAALADALASVHPAPPAEASSVLATAISLPPDAIEPESLEAPAPAHTPTLAPPAGESLPPVPERVVPSSDVAIAVQAPVPSTLARPHTVPYWNEAATEPAAHPASLAPAPVPARSVAPMGSSVPVPARMAAPAVAAPAPSIPPVPMLSPRGSGRRWAAVGLGVAIGIVVGVVAFGRSRGLSPGGTTTGGATEPASSVPSAALPAPPPPADASAAELPAAAGTAAVAPAPASAEPASPTPVDSAPAAPEVIRPDDAELTIVCEPACDLVAIDSRAVTDYPRPVHLRPGVHGVGASRAHYGGQWKQVTVRAHEKATVTFALTPSSSGAKKPCGQFLKRCRD
jgi:serine/threonine protein kinase